MALAYGSMRGLAGWTASLNPALFINAAAPLLAPLFATNPSSVDRMHSYDLLPQNPLQTKVLRNHHGDS